MLFQSLLLVLFYALGLVSAKKRKFDFTITKGDITGGGFTRQGFLINGLSPGPEISVDQGDDVEVFVRNSSPREVTVHFHGIEQKGTIFSDGVPGVTQKVITPGGTFRYKWNANKAGAYWYHAHFRADYVDGLRGLINVRSLILDYGFYKPISSNLVDMAALEVAQRNPSWLSVADWKHIDTEEELRITNQTLIETVCASSMLINGKGSQFCLPPEAYFPYAFPLIPEWTAKGCGPATNPALQFPGARPDLLTDPAIFDVCTPHAEPLSIIKVDPFYRYAAITLINIGGMWDAKISIDSHKFWVYAADGQLVTPQQVDAINVPLGDRFQVFVKLDQTPGDYIIRIAANALLQKIAGYAVLSYKRRVPSKGVLGGLLDSIRPISDAEDVSPDVFLFDQPPPNTARTKIGYGSEIINNGVELDPLSMVPYPASVRPPQKSNKLITLNMARLGPDVYAMNKDPYASVLELQTPLLEQPSLADKLDPDLVPSIPSGSVVDLVFINNAPAPPHAIHKHGSKAFIIGQGVGPFIWETTEEAITANPQFFNLKNPPLRDGFLTLPAIEQTSWLMVRYVSDDPAPISLHCHIQLHSAMGMVVVLMEGADKFPKIPAGLTN